MRVVAGIFCAVLVLFAAAQTNDPDPEIWMTIYGTGALWCGIAALFPALFRHAVPRLLCLLSFLASLAGVWFWWPDTAEFWKLEAWWETETAREGMGAMSLAFAMLFPVLVALRSGRG